MEFEKPEIKLSKVNKKIELEKAQNKLSEDNIIRENQLYQIKQLLSYFGITEKDFKDILNL